MKPVNELRSAIQALLPLVEDGALLTRFLTLLASSAAKPTDAIPGTSAEYVRPRKRPRVENGSVSISNEQFVAIMLMRIRTGPSELSRRLSVPHQTLLGLIRSEGRCMPQTADAIAKGLSAVPANERVPLSNDPAELRERLASEDGALDRKALVEILVAAAEVRGVPLLGIAEAVGIRSVDALDILMGRPVQRTVSDKALAWAVDGPPDGDLRREIAMEVYARASVDGCSVDDVLSRVGIRNLTAADDAQLAALRELLDN